MRDYGKVFSTFWTSDSTRELSDDAKVLALYLLTGPHSNIIGCFRLPDGYASEDLGWTAQRVSKGFGELFRKGFATREESSKWVFVNKHLKWNPLENPNQITGALKLYEQIPDTSSVKPLMATALREYTKSGLKGFETLPEPLANPSGTLSKPETETETEEIKTPPYPPPGGEGESGSPKRFVPPEPEEVEAYCLERRNGITGREFCDFYGSKGWMVGKSRMKDWRAAVRTWENKRKAERLELERTRASPVRHVIN